mgnify:CR=1 FL=1
MKVGFRGRGWGLSNKNVTSPRNSSGKAYSFATIQESISVPYKYVTSMMLVPITWEAHSSWHPH